MKDTVEVPIKWLEKLIKLGREAKVEVYSSGVLNQSRVETGNLDYLKGYIGSAEQFIDSDKEEEV